MSAEAILVVEDNPITRKMMRVALEIGGYEVIEAENGHGALEASAARRPDLMILDYVLPDMDALQLLAEARRLAPPEVPAIVVTGMVSRLDEMRAQSGPSTQFLAKPVAPSQLLDVVRAQLSTPQGRTAGQRLLVVDDEPLNLKLATFRLKRAGYEVETASGGEEGLAIARRRPPDAILTDVLMPSMDGFAFCREARRHPALGAIPIVLISSAYVDEPDRELARQMGANALVVRTSDLRDAMAALAAGLHGASAPPPTASDERVATLHRERLQVQLERQTSRNEALLRQASIQAAALSIMRGLSEVLSQPRDMPKVLGDVLVHCLDAAGLSTGLLYLAEPDGRHRLQAQFGIPADRKADAESLLRDPELIRRVLDAREPAAFSSGAEQADHQVREFLARLGHSSALILPFVVLGESLGVLVLASDTHDLSESAWLGFAQSLALQFGQTVALGQSLTRLAASEGRYGALMEHANDAFLILDPTGKFVEVNREAERLLGRPRTEIVGRHYDEFVVPGEQADSARLLDQLLAKGTLRVEERQFVRADGVPVWVEVSASLVPFGEQPAVLTILRDITEGRRAKQEITERMKLAAFTSDIGAALIRDEPLPVVLQQCAEAMMRHLEPAFARIWTLNRPGDTLELQASAGMYTHLNGAHARVPVGQFKIGLIAAEREPHLTNDVIHDPRVSDQAWARREGMVAFAGYPLVVGDDPVGVMAMFARHPLSPNVLSSMAAVANQIALGIKRKRSEEEHRASEERYRLLFESNPHPMWVCEQETFAFLAVNDAALRHYGYSRDELLSMTALDIQPPEEVANVREEFEAFMAKREPGRTYRSPHTFKHRRKDAAIIEVDISANPIVFEGRKAWLLLATDVTEKRSLEAQLLQSQKMESMGRLAGGVAHDFNNLLGIITGYGELLRKRVAADPRLLRYVDDIVKAAERAAGLTRQLLAFSRKQVLQPRILDLNAVVTETEKMLRRLIGEDIQLVTVLDEQVGPVRADPGQMDQVLMNMAVNARDAMPRGGRLTIETGNVVLDQAYARHHAGVAPGHYVMLALSDTGHGMTPEVRMRIFEPFFTTKDPGKGTGLGLATVHGIVQQSGGHIWVYSEPGHGTTFKLYLPRTDNPGVADDAPKPAHVELPRGSETILLVEDEASLREMVRECLEAAGYTVLEASHATAALEVSERYTGRIDLLMTDVVMPGRSGRELAERLRASQPEICVVYMSGYTDDAVILHGVLAEEMAFLQKPFTADALLRKLREVLDAPNG